VAHIRVGFQIQGFTRLYHGDYPRVSLHWEDRLSLSWELQLVETTLNDAGAESLVEGTRKKRGEWVELWLVRANTKKSNATQHSGRDL
jgi:hypothetical protein